MTLDQAREALINAGCKVNVVSFAGTDSLTVWKEGVCLAGFPVAWITPQRIAALQKRAGSINPAGEPDFGWYVTEKGFAVLERRT